MGRRTGQFWDMVLFFLDLEYHGVGVCGKKCWVWGTCLIVQVSLPYDCRCCRLLQEKIPWLPACNGSVKSD